MRKDAKIGPVWNLLVLQQDGSPAWVAGETSLWFGPIVPTRCLVLCPARKQSCAAVLRPCQSVTVANGACAARHVSAACARPYRPPHECPWYLVPAGVGLCCVCAVGVSLIGLPWSDRLGQIAALGALCRPSPRARAVRPVPPRPEPNWRPEKWRGERHQELGQVCERENECMSRSRSVNRELGGAGGKSSAANTGG